MAVFLRPRSSPAGYSKFDMRLQIMNRDYGVVHACSNGQQSQPTHGSNPKQMLISTNSGENIDESYAPKKCTPGPAETHNKDGIQTQGRVQRRCQVTRNAPRMDMTDNQITSCRGQEAKAVCRRHRSHIVSPCMSPL